MIQRIQSVWLFVAALVLYSLFLFPYLNFIDLVGLGKKVMVSGLYTALNNDFTRQETYLGQTIATVVVASFPLFIIFQFKNRKRQIALIFVAISLILLLSIYLFVHANTLLSGISQSVTPDTIGVGFFLLPVAIICLALALGAIRKDEKLIKSADRLR